MDALDQLARLPSLFKEVTVLVSSENSVTISMVHPLKITLQLNKLVMSHQLLVRADSFDHVISVDVESLLTQNLVPQD